MRHAARIFGNIVAPRAAASDGCASRAQSASMRDKVWLNEARDLGRKDGQDIHRVVVGAMTRHHHTATLATIIIEVRAIVGLRDKPPPLHIRCGANVHSPRGTEGREASNGVLHLCFNCASLVLLLCFTYAALVFFIFFDFPYIFSSFLCIS